MQQAVDYFRTARSEMQKVSWPSRRDTLRYSALVIAISIVIAAGFAALDSGLTSLVASTITVTQESQAPAASSDQNAAPIVPVGSPQVETSPVTTQAPVVTPTPAPSANTNGTTINLNNAKPITTPTPTK